jgi:hypothetical protein
MTTTTQPLTQKERILARLQRGPATNRDLNQIAFRYSARIAELRDEGHSIVWSPVKGRQGLTLYRLENAS